MCQCVVISSWRFHFLSDATLFFCPCPLQSEGLQENFAAEKKAKGRTGWPQQVWALELNQWPAPPAPSPPSTVGPLLTPEQINTQEPLTGWTRTLRCTRAMMRKTSEIKEVQARDPGASVRPVRDARVIPVSPPSWSSSSFSSSRCLVTDLIFSLFVMFRTAEQKNSPTFPLKNRLIWSQVSVFFTFGSEAENKGRIEAQSRGLTTKKFNLFWHFMFFNFFILLFSFLAGGGGLSFYQFFFSTVSFNAAGMWNGLFNTFLDFWPQNEFKNRAYKLFAPNHMN